MRHGPHNKRMKNAAGIVDGNPPKIELRDKEVRDPFDVGGVDAGSKYNRECRPQRTSDPSSRENSPIHNQEWYISESDFPGVSVAPTHVRRNAETRVRSDSWPAVLTGPPAPA